MSVVVSLYSLTPDNFQAIKDKEHKEISSLGENQGLANLLVVEKSVYLDKSWEIMSFILTGNKGFLVGNDLSEIIFPQESVRIDFYYDGEKDATFFEYTHPIRVEKIYNHLKDITKDKFKNLFDERDFDKVKPYPSPINWNRPGKFDSIYSHFDNVKFLFKEAAENGFYVGRIIEY